MGDTMSFVFLQWRFARIRIASIWRNWYKAKIKELKVI